LFRSRSFEREANKSCSLLRLNHFCNHFASKLYNSLDKLQSLMLSFKEDGCRVISLEINSGLGRTASDYRRVITGSRQVVLEHLPACPSHSFRLITLPVFLLEYTIIGYLICAFAPWIDQICTRPSSSLVTTKQSNSLNSWLNVEEAGLAYRGI
jgi:hypothetical protein